MGSSGGPRRFSGHGFNRVWASDSIAQSLFLLISHVFYSLFSYMDSNGDPGGSWGGLWGPQGVLGDPSGGLQAMDLTARGAPSASGKVWEHHRGSWKTLGRPLASGGPQGF